MTSPSPEIYLKSTSLMSLNDRFSSIGKKPELIDLSGNVQQLQTASLKNQQLAQQMANWPSVLSALRNIPSLKHRLGRGNIKARLSRPLMRGGLHGVARRSGKLRGRGPSLRGTLSVRCVRGLQGVVSGFVTHQGLNRQYQGASVSEPRVMQNRGVRGSMRGNGRGMFVGHGRGGGRRWAESRPVPTREELDEQLDDYMSMTKSHLDAQLDAYMAEVDSGDFL
ncbi:chromatin target of PRMT1 protein-like [Astyanax mexicanus]|uniref:Chromatin target of PRMT1 protein-like n=1 Tax=Astyanax mexicanus TaxID=7994 RepID=A0A8T2LYZ1_ASTMX|nr:chromatin target of PRMT1 protein-like [Astyanax mexicanus]